MISNIAAPTLTSAEDSDVMLTGRDVDILAEGRRVAQEAILGRSQWSENSIPLEERDSSLAGTVLQIY